MCYQTFFEEILTHNYSWSVIAGINGDCLEEILSVNRRQCNYRGKNCS